MKTIIKSIVTILIIIFFQQQSFAGEVISWKFKTRGIVYSSPLIVGNTVYIGSGDSTLYAIDLENGLEKWQFKAGNKILSTAAFFNDIICFESGNVLYGLNLDGTEKWKVTISEGNITNQYDEWDCFHSSPNIIDGIAYVGGERGKVIGVNVETGEEIFRIDTGNKGVGVRVKPAVWENKLYFGECSGIFYCYDITTQEKIWEYDTNPEKLWSDPSILTNPIINDGIVYFGGRHCHLYGLNAQDGSKVWWYSDPKNMWILGGPTISDSLLFVGSSNQQILHGFKITTQELMWKKNFDGRIFGTPFVKNDKVYFGTGMEVNDKIGSLFAIDKNTGEILNRFIVSAQVHSSPIVISGKIIFGSTNGYVYALNEEEMLNSEHPESRFSDESEINVGEIKRDTTISVGITNPYNLSDSVSFSWFYPRLSSKNITIEPNNLILPPLSQINISFNIKTSTISAGNYTIQLRMNRHLTLNPADKEITKAIRFSIPSLVSVNESRLLFEYNLSQNYPNPFNPTTHLNYSINSRQFVTLKVYDILGNEVATLVNEEKPAGKYEVEFDANTLSSGIYFYRLIAGNFENGRSFVQTKKMQLIR